MIINIRSWVEALITWANENGSLEKDHVVVDEIEDHQLRVRRGPVGKLKVVQYRPNIGDDRMLMDASHDIAKLIDGPLRRNFLENVVYSESRQLDDPQEDRSLGERQLI